MDRSAHDPPHARPRSSARTVQVSGAGLLGEWAEWVVTPPNPIGDAPRASRSATTGPPPTSQPGTLRHGGQSSAIGRRCHPTASPDSPTTCPTRSPTGWPLRCRSCQRRSGRRVLRRHGLHARRGHVLCATGSPTTSWRALSTGVVLPVRRPRNMASRTRARLVPLLKAGNHRWRWKVENVARIIPRTAVCSLSPPLPATSATSVAILEDWLHTHVSPMGSRRSTTASRSRGAPSASSSAISTTRCPPICRWPTGRSTSRRRSTRRATPGPSCSRGSGRA